MVADNNTFVRRLALFGIPLAFGVMGLKLCAWWVTGSVALLSDALESTVNVIAAFLAYFVIRYAQKPADDDHPYGHHKAEYLSAVLEGVLIVVAALLIIREAIPALQNPTLPDAPFLGLAINGLAAVINAAWATVLIRVGRSHRSPALSADGQHIMSDVVTSVGVIVGLLLVLATGHAILDPVLAILVALNIIWQGWKVIAQSVAGLMDVAVSPEEAEAIRQAIKENSEGSLGVHYLRSRRAGAATFVAFDLVVPSTMSVRDAHLICDRLEMAVHDAVPGTRVTIHVEPENEMAHGAGIELSR